MEKTLEQSLLAEALKQLAERRRKQKEYICSAPLEHNDYVQRVGQIRAIDEIEEDFKELHNAFFPST